MTICRIATTDTYDKAYIIGVLEELPPIEPKRGKWMAIGNTGLAACECGYITDRYSIYKHCPNCGAKMYGDIKDSE